ncbi:MAG: hypothetical protein PHX20_04640 [Candidatus Omnitrophica bacterium]|nr:hypothetical protein [Candidatus Omnitrophota bacterium]MDD5436813.1 hypothetical protein [Candidatus Omnitrophota bacterium]
MKARRAVFCITAAIFFISACAYSQEIIDEGKVKMMGGEVVEADTVGGTFVIRWFGWDNGLSYHTTTFRVLSSTKIVKGNSVISFLDVNHLDYVIVRYTDTGALAPVALTVLVDNKM